MTRIIYIHGFGSSSKSAKAQVVKSVAEAMGCEFVPIDYDATLSPEKIGGVIAKQIGKRSCDEILVGSSLGGFWAEMFATRYSPLMLINPCLRPSKSLGKYGISEETLKEWAFFESYVEDDGLQGAGVLLVGMKDDVVNPQFALDFYKNTMRIVQDPESDHLFTNHDLIRDELQKLITWYQTQEHL